MIKLVDGKLVPSLLSYDGVIPDATMKDYNYITMKNDLSFLVDSQMSLYEQQSTYNPNMLIIENPLKKIVRQRNFLGSSK